MIEGREARPAGPGWNVAKTLGQTAVFWTVFLVLMPAAVYSLESWLGWTSWRFPSTAGQLAGGLLFVAGGALGLTSGITMACRGRGTPLPLDCPRQIVVVGPYRYVRNPMALAGLAQGVAVGIFLGSPAVVVYALCGGPAWNVLVRPWEERDLEQRFGNSYRHYRDSIRCWWPTFRGYHPPESSADSVADANSGHAEREHP